MKMKKETIQNNGVLVFKTTQSDLIKHNNKQLTIIRELEKNVEYDYIEDETPLMYEVMLITGEIIQVFEDEIIKAN